MPFLTLPFGLTEYESELLGDALHTYLAECRTVDGCERLADDLFLMRGAWLKLHRAAWPNEAKP